MIVDLQDFIYAYYREILFVSIGSMLVTSLLIAIVVILRAVDEQR